MASLLWPLQFPPMRTGDKSDKKGTCVYVRFLFFFFIFAPVRAITIHGITGPRNNNPQEDSCWKALYCIMKDGEAGGFFVLKWGVRPNSDWSSLKTTKDGPASDTLFKSACIDFNFRVQMEPWLMNDRMLLESHCNKSLKILKLKKWVSRVSAQKEY